MCIGCVAAQAQVVVRVSGKRVYVDTSEVKTAVKLGDSLKVILSSERLINPQTGKDLGPLYTYSQAGKIVEVQPLYVVGELPGTAKIEIGQKVVIEPQPAAAVPAATAALPSAPAVRPSEHARKTYEPLPEEIISISSADVMAPQADNFVTLSAGGKISVWAKRGEQVIEQASYRLPANKTPVTVSAVALRPGNTADVFAVVYEPEKTKLYTLVLSVENGQLRELQTLPYFVKEMGCGVSKTLWAQKPFISGTYPGNMRNVVYQNDRFTVGKETKPSQRNWLTGLAFFPAQQPGTENLFFTAPNGKINLVLANGKKAFSTDRYASAPNRVKYKQAILKFYPSLQVFGTPGHATVAAVSNESKLGLLSETFGQYHRGSVHFLTYEKGRLAETDAVELDGVVYDTACSETGILTAEVLPGGQSSIVEILK